MSAGDAARTCADERASTRGQAVTNTAHGWHPSVGWRQLHRAQPRPWAGAAAALGRCKWLLLLVTPAYAPCPRARAAALTGPPEMDML